MKTMQIYRSNTIGYGAFVCRIPTLDEYEAAGGLDGNTADDKEGSDDIRDFGAYVAVPVAKLAEGTGIDIATCRPWTLPNWNISKEDRKKMGPILILLRGGRATPVYPGQYVVRSIKFGPPGRAGLVVMDEDRFAENIGFRDMSDNGAQPVNYPDVDASRGASEDVQARRDNNLPVDHPPTDPTDDGALRVIVQGSSTDPSKDRRHQTPDPD